MPKYSTSSRLVTETLDKLDHLRGDPTAIDAGFEDGSVSPCSLLMTSIGARRKAALTPAYPGIAFKWNLAHRYMMARAHQRPFVEAGISYNRETVLAHVTLRLCMDPYAGKVTETTWGYQLDPIYAHTTTTDEVLIAIQEAGDSGVPINSRSGLVVVTNEKLANNSWSMSYEHNPSDVAAAIYQSVAEDLLFHDI